MHCNGHHFIRILIRPVQGQLLGGSTAGSPIVGVEAYWMLGKCYTPDSYTLSKGFSVGLTNNTKISLGFNSRRYYLGLSYNTFAMSTMAGSYRDWIF